MCRGFINIRISRGVINSKKNSVAVVREGTIHTERQPLVGEVSATFCG
jgi:hypothetical protein